MWAKYRRKSLGLCDAREGPLLHLPDQQIAVPVRVYAYNELETFTQWFNGVYLPRNFQTYLDGKPEF